MAKKLKTISEMTQEERKLLNSELCARIPYGVICQGEYQEEASYRRPYGGWVKVKGTIEGTDNVNGDFGREKYFIIEGQSCPDSTVYPYLRPLVGECGMTTEEFEELRVLCPNILYNCTKDDSWVIKFDDKYSTSPDQVGQMNRLINFLKTKQFDYCGLIESRLAVKVTKKNNPYKK